MMVVNANGTVFSNSQALPKTERWQEEAKGRSSTPTSFDTLLNDLTVAQTGESKDGETSFRKGDEERVAPHEVLHMFMSLSETEWRKMLGDAKFHSLKRELQNWQGTEPAENRLSSLFSKVGLVTDEAVSQRGGNIETDITGNPPFFAQVLQFILAHRDGGNLSEHSALSTGPLLNRLYALFLKWQETLPNEGQHTLANERLHKGTSGKSDMNELLQRVLALVQERRIADGEPLPKRLIQKGDADREFVERVLGQVRERNMGGVDPLLKNTMPKSGTVGEWVQRFFSQDQPRGSQDSDPNKVRIPAQHTFFHSGPMDRVHQLEMHTNARNHLAESTLAEQLERALASSRLQSFKNGTTTLNVRLYPEHLGSLAVKLVHANGELVARITAETMRAKQLLESQLHHLRHAFAGQQLNVEKIEVMNQPQQQHLQQHEQDGKGSRRDQEQKFDEEQHERADERQDDDVNSFQTWLNELTV